MSQPLTFNMFEVELIISSTILFLFLQPQQPAEHPHRNPGIFPFHRVGPPSNHSPYAAGSSSRISLTSNASPFLSSGPCHLPLVYLKSLPQDKYKCLKIITRPFIIETLSSLVSPYPLLWILHTPATLNISVVPPTTTFSLAARPLHVLL